MLEYNKIVAVRRGKATGSPSALQNYSLGHDQQMRIENCPKICHLGHTVGGLVRCRSIHGLELLSGLCRKKTARDSDSSRSIPKTIGG